MRVVTECVIWHKLLLYSNQIPTATVNRTPVKQFRRHHNLLLFRKVATVTRTSIFTGKRRRVH